MSHKEPQKTVCKKCDNEIIPINKDTSTEKKQLSQIVRTKKYKTVYQGQPRTLIQLDEYNDYTELRISFEYVGSPLTYEISAYSEKQSKSIRVTHKEFLSKRNINDIPYYDIVGLLADTEYEINVVAFYSTGDAFSINKRRIFSTKKTEGFVSSGEIEFIFPTNIDVSLDNINDHNTSFQITYPKKNDSVIVYNLTVSDVNDTIDYSYNNTSLNFFDISGGILFDTLYNITLETVYGVIQLYDPVSTSIKTLNEGSIGNIIYEEVQNKSAIIHYDTINGNLVNGKTYTLYFGNEEKGFFTDTISGNFIVQGLDINTTYSNVYIATNYRETNNTYRYIQEFSFTTLNESEPLFDDTQCIAENKYLTIKLLDASGNPNYSWIFGNNEIPDISNGYSDNTEYNFTNLSIDTEYYFDVSSVYTNTLNSYGPVNKKLTTLNQDSVTFNNNDAVIESDNLKFMFTLAPGKVISYDFSFGEIRGVSIENGVLLNTDVSYAFNNLEVDTSYVFTVTSIYNDPIRRYTDKITATTQGEIAANFDVNEITGNSITIQIQRTNQKFFDILWGEINNANQRIGIPISYYDKSNENIQPNASNQYIISDLEPDMSYQIMLKSFYTGRDISYVVEGEIRTLSESFVNISDVFLYHNRIDVSFVPYNNANDVSFVLTYNTTELEETRDTYIEISGLTYYNAYNVTIKSIYSTGNEYYIHNTFNTLNERALTDSEIEQNIYIRSQIGNIVTYNLTPTISDISLNVITIDNNVSQNYEDNTVVFNNVEHLQQIHGNIVTKFIERDSNTIDYITYHYETQDYIYDISFIAETSDAFYIVRNHSIQLDWFDLCNNNDISYNIIVTQNGQDISNITINDSTVRTYEITDLSINTEYSIITNRQTDNDTYTSTNILTTLNEKEIDVSDIVVLNSGMYGNEIVLHIQQIIGDYSENIVTLDNRYNESSHSVPYMNIFDISVNYLQTYYGNISTLYDDTIVPYDNYHFMYETKKYTSDISFTVNNQMAFPIIRNNELDIDYYNEYFKKDSHPYNWNGKSIIMSKNIQQEVFDVDDIFSDAEGESLFPTHNGDPYTNNSYISEYTSNQVNGIQKYSYDVTNSTYLRNGTYTFCANYVVGERVNAPRYPTFINMKTSSGVDYFVGISTGYIEFSLPYYLNLKSIRIAAHTEDGIVYMPYIYKIVGIDADNNENELIEKSWAGNYPVGSGKVNFGYDDSGSTDFNDFFKDHFTAIANGYIQNYNYPTDVKDDNQYINNYYNTFRFYNLPHSGYYRIKYIEFNGKGTKTLTRDYQKILVERDVSNHVVLYKQYPTDETAYIEQTFNGEYLFKHHYDFKMFVANHYNSSTTYSYNHYASDTVEYQVQFYDENDDIVYQTSPIVNTDTQWNQLHLKLYFDNTLYNPRVKIRRTKYEYNDLFISDISMVETHIHNDLTDLSDNAETWDTATMTEVKKWRDLNNYSDICGNVITLTNNMTFSFWLFLHDHEVTKTEKGLFVVGNSINNGIPSIYIDGNRRGSDNGTLVIKNIYESSINSNVLRESIDKNIPIFYTITYYNNEIVLYKNGEIVQRSQPDNFLRETALDNSIYFGTPNTYQTSYIVYKQELYDYKLEPSQVNNIYNSTKDQFSQMLNYYDISESRIDISGEHKINLPFVASRVRIVYRWHNDISLNKLIPFNNLYDSYDSSYNASNVNSFTLSFWICIDNQYINGNIIKNGTYQVSYSNKKIVSHGIEIPINVSQYVHFVFVYSNAKYSAYMNGYLYDYNSYYTGQTDFSIWKIGGIKGKIGEIVFYKDALQLDEIFTLYHNHYYLYNSFERNHQIVLRVPPKNIEYDLSYEIFDISSVYQIDLENIANISMTGSLTNIFYNDINNDTQEDKYYVAEISMNAINQNDFNKNNESLTIRLPKYNIERIVSGNGFPYILPSADFSNNINKYVIDEGRDLSFTLVNYNKEVSYELSGIQLKDIYPRPDILSGNFNGDVSFNIWNDFKTESNETFTFTISELNLQVVVQISDTSILILGVTSLNPGLGERFTVFMNNTSLLQQGSSDISFTIDSTFTSTNLSEVISSNESSVTTIFSESDAKTKFVGLSHEFVVLKSDNLNIRGERLDFTIPGLTNDTLSIYLADIDDIEIIYKMNQEEITINSESIPRLIEDISFQIQITVPRIFDGFEIPYEIKGNTHSSRLAVNQEDFLGNDISGVFVINAGTSSLEFFINNSTENIENLEYFDFIIHSVTNNKFNKSISYNSQLFYIEDTNRLIEYDLSVIPQNVNEGNTIIFIVYAKYAPDGHVVEYELSGTNITTEDFDPILSNLNGTLEIQDGSANLILKIKEDEREIINEDLIFIVTIPDTDRTIDISSTIINTSPIVQINSVYTSSSNGASIKLNITDNFNDHLPAGNLVLKGNTHNIVRDDTIISLLDADHDNHYQLFFNNNDIVTFTMKTIDNIDTSLSLELIGSGMIFSSSSDETSMSVTDGGKVLNITIKFLSS